MISFTAVFDELHDVANNALRERDLLKSIEALKSVEVLVGIPEKNGERRGDDDVNNASLLYTHTNGSPLKNIPARPVIEPAISEKGNAEKISSFIKDMTQTALRGDRVGVARIANLLGQDAVNMIKMWFVDPRNGWPPNSPLTVRRKLDKMKVSKKRKAFLFAAYLSGDPDVNTVLVDTAQMRNAITFVVKGL